MTAETFQWNAWECLYSPLRRIAAALTEEAGMRQNVMWLLLAMLPWTANAFGETVQLKDGQRVAGTIQSADSRQIKINTDKGVQTVSVAEVQSISMSEPVPDEAAPGEPVTAPVARSGQGGSLPAGTAINVRTVDAIDSESNDPNREYWASVSDPIAVNGATVVPAGADAILRVVEAKKAGTFTGRASLALKLVSLAVNGQQVFVETGEARLSSRSQAGTTATRAAIGAAVGAGLGGIFGGGKGAGIGAAAGGLGGAATAGLSGQKVSVPAETRLAFTLAQTTQLY